MVRGAHPRGQALIRTDGVSDLERLAAGGDYEGWLARYEAEAQAAARSKGRGDPRGRDAYLRALGEVRGPEALARAYLALEPVLAGTHRAVVSETGRLYLFAYAGRSDLVERALERLPGLDAETRRFWTATADLAAGRAATALAEFERLHAALAEGNGSRGEVSAGGEKGRDPALAATVRRRLERSLPGTRGELSAQSRALIERVAAQLHDEARFGDAQRPASAPRPVAVFGLMALLVTAFAVELVRGGLGGSTDPRNLHALGAFFPPAILDEHEWWRLGTYALLHLGPLHLGFNLIGLYVMGPFVERALGALGVVLVFLCASLAGSGLGLLLYALRLVGTQFLVGASGGVMGLVGATAALLVVGRLREGSQVAGQRLSSLAFFIALQTAFDFTMPGVSFTAHAAGLVSGFVLTLPFAAIRASAHRR